MVANALALACGSVRRLLALWVVAGAAVVVLWAPQPAAATGGLSVTKTADPYSERAVVYDWTIEKSVAPGSLELGSGETGQVAYTITATRTKVSDTTVSGVRGEICVTNDTTVVASAVVVEDTLSASLGGGSQVIVAEPTFALGDIAPGATTCAEYAIDFEPVDGALRYKNVARAHASNFISGNVTVFFELPAGVTSTTSTDEQADIVDQPDCPPGYVCVSDDNGPWHLTGSGTVSFTARVTNESANCGTNTELVNLATLTENDTLTERTDSATVQLASLCVDVGCTRTIGFWKTHAGTKGNNPDLVTPLLPISLGTAGGTKTVVVTTAAQAITILSKSGDASNGINKLMAQLLAAKLNVASGASATVVASTIAQADAVLATAAASDWSGLSASAKQNVLALAETLDDYNNGLIGPPHCD